MKDHVELNATYPHPPERVWQALTDPDALRAWLLPADFKPLIGFRFRFDRKDGEPIKGKVIEVEEGKVLAYTWDDGESPEPSVVCWTLSPDGDGTRVDLQHRYVETPEVTSLPIDAHFNWSYAMRYSLPGLLALLSGMGGVRARPPIVYLCDTTLEDEPRERIGFRKELVAQ